MEAARHLGGWGCMYGGSLASGWVGLHVWRQVRLLRIWVGGATRMENGEAARHLGVWGCTYGSASR